VAVRTRLGVAAGRLAARTSRALGRGEGAVISGAAARFIAPDAWRELAAGRRVVLLSGTNGKTTTTAMTAAALGALGPVATNATGANMPNGIVGCLLADPAPLAVLEVDEAVLPAAVRDLGPELVVLLNLSRDQLDRYHEVRRTADGWRDALSRSKARVVANADDPLIVWAASESDTTWVAMGHSWRLDASTCPACGGAIDFSDAAGWRCTACAFARPPVEADAADPAEFPLSLPLPGRFNRANALTALTAARLLGVAADDAAPRIASVRSVAGRYATIKHGSTSYRLLLAKNPAGWQEMLDLLGDRPVVLALNARSEDGIDPSWIYDVPFERLKGIQAVCTGERGADLSVRLTYAGVEHRFAPDYAGAFDAAAELAGESNAEVDVVGNYSAFQQMRKVMAGGW
jgi:lipid II isoglutaminyl synthase (glutamine-hydrolysing)